MAALPNPLLTAPCHWWGEGDTVEERQSMGRHRGEGPRQRVMSQAKKSTEYLMCVSPTWALLVGSPYLTLLGDNNGSIPASPFSHPAILSSHCVPALYTHFLAGPLNGLNWKALISFI